MKYCSQINNNLLTFFILISYRSAIDFRGFGAEASVCSSDRDCDSGKRCIRYLGSCQLGVCSCHLLTQVKLLNGHCANSRYIGDYCSLGDVCLGESKCSLNVCSCIHPSFSTSDHLHCLGHNQKLLGQSCQPEIHQCLQRTGQSYSSTDVFCSEDRERCECVEGLVKDSLTCRELRIGEYGCKEIYHCSGGSVCVGGRCRCPQYYKLSAKGTKCVPQRAIENLPLNAICDEVNEKAFCGWKLICSTCPNQRYQETCQKSTFEDEHEMNTLYFHSSANSINIRANYLYIRTNFSYFVTLITACFFVGLFDMVAKLALFIIVIYSHYFAFQFLLILFYKF